MNFDLGQATAGLHALIVHFTQRLPYMGLAIIVFIAFYIAGLILRRLAARFTRPRGGTAASASCSGASARACSCCSAS